MPSQSPGWSLSKAPALSISMSAGFDPGMSLGSSWRHVDVRWFRRWILPCCLYFILLGPVLVSGQSQNYSGIQEIQDHANDTASASALDARVRAQMETLPLAQQPAVLESDVQRLRNASGKTSGSQPGSNTKPGEWFFLWLLALVFLLAVIRVQFARDIREWWRALINPNLAHQLQRDREFALTAHGILLFLLYVCSMGTWAWLMLLRLGIRELPFFGTFSLASSIVAVIFIVFSRDALRRLVGLLFRAEDEMAFFGFEITLLQSLAGAFLLPFLFLIAYSSGQVADIASLLSAFLLVGLFGWRSFRGFQAGSRSLQRNVFAFLLYICTLEIAPLAVAMKALIGWLSIG